MTGNHVEMVLTGSAELEAGLRGLPRWIRDEVLEDALVAGGIILLNGIKTKAIAAGVYLTGTLVRSYHIGGHTDSSPDFNSSEGYGDIGGIIQGPDWYAILVGTNLPYARRQEFGFDDLTDRLGRTFHQKARPHIRPAFDELTDAVMKEIGEAMGAKLVIVAKRI
jgi:hypothetical protein